MKHHGVVLVAVFQLAVSATLLCAQESNSPAVTLSADQVAKAIAEGQSTKELKALRLGKRASLIKSAVVYEMGQVYTPELRIALSARATKAKYAEFLPKDVTEEIGGNYILVVLPPMGVDAENHRNVTDVETVLVLPKGASDPGRAIRPLWLKTDIATYQNGFGARWEEKTLLAAFPPNALSPDVEFVAIYRTAPYYGAGPTKQELRGVLLDKLTK